MGKSKSRAQQFADLAAPVAQDFDPEEDAPAQRSDEDSGSEESGDELAGTEHYAAVGKSKLRKVDEVVLGPEYSGSKVSRKALLEDDNDEDDYMEDGEAESASDSDDDGESENTKYADPDELDFEVDDDDEEIDSDGALGDSDAEEFAKFTFRGSSKPKTKGKRPTAADFMSDREDEDLAAGDESDEPETDEDVLDVNAQHADDDEDSMDEVEGDMEKLDVDSESEDDDMEADKDQDSSSEDDDEDGEAARRAELRKIMNDEQKTVVATISQAAKADAEKGIAVQQQRKAFDSLLSVRMVVQKALIATNSMAASDDKDSEDSVNKPYEAAEEAAIKLWNTLEDMRHELAKKTGSKAGQKRKRDIDSSISSSKIWDRMQNTEVSMIDNRQSTLEKWSAKVRGSTSLPLSRKLNPTAQQSITSILQDQLTNSDHLVKKTKMPRSCAPVQRDQKVIEDPDIYDDGNFYQMLLKELVDQRRVESLSAPAGADGSKAMQWVAVKEAKTRKNVDTKASKGRKMRFTVHEKLQNFMAPDDRASWEPERIDRFFGTLLGQKMTLAEDEDASDDEEDVPMEDEGLMLFKS